MSQKTSGVRVQHHEIEIDAPIEAVWRAISEAEHVARWFACEAQIEPVEGGKYWVSWGEGQDGGSEIEKWDPPNRLRLRTLTNPEITSGPGSAPTWQEYTLESRGNKTVLRLTHSMPDSPDWDQFYGGTDRGWALFFPELRNYIERHFDKPRREIMVLRPVAMNAEDAWRKVLSPEGLNCEKTFGSGSTLKEGSAYSLTTSFGETMSGTVHYFTPPGGLSLTVDNLNSAYFAFSFEEMGGLTFFYLSLSTFGLPEERFEDLRTKWMGWTDGLFPAATPPTS